MADLCSAGDSVDPHNIPDYGEGDDVVDDESVCDVAEQCDDGSDFNDAEEREAALLEDAQLQMPDESVLGKPTSPEQFRFEKTFLGTMLKPQLTSDFMCRELGTEPASNVDVDAILRKYGIEPRKYGPTDVPKSSYCWSGDPTRQSSSNYGSSKSNTPWSSTRTPMDVSQNNEAPPITDTSTNNDTEVAETTQEKPDTNKLTAAHGSSVDFTSTLGSDSTPMMSRIGSQSSFRGDTGYSSGFSSMRMRSYTMASNMDTSPFGGSYLKYHMNTKYGSSEFSTSNGLSYSLMQERQRLRQIDHLIKSGPTRLYMSQASSKTTPSISGISTPKMRATSDPNDTNMLGSSVDASAFSQPWFANGGSSTLKLMKKESEVHDKNSSKGQKDDSFNANSDWGVRDSTNFNWIARNHDRAWTQKHKGVRNVTIKKEVTKREHGKKNEKMSSRSMPSFHQEKQQMALVQCQGKKYLPYKFLEDERKERTGPPNHDRRVTDDQCKGETSYSSHDVMEEPSGHALRRMRQQQRMDELSRPKRHVGDKYSQLQMFRPMSAAAFPNSSSKTSKRVKRPTVKPRPKSATIYRQLAK